MRLWPRARRTGWTPLTYVPYHELGGRPNVIADGAPTAGTVLSISHWPHLPVPAGLEADLSAEMTLRYAAQPGSAQHTGAAAVSNDHFDQDGLVSLYVLTHPEVAGTTLAARLIEIAAAGDFARSRDRDAARASMVMAAWADPARTPLELPDTYGERCALLYREFLRRLPELAEDVAAYRQWWEREDEFLARSEQALDDGNISLSEHPDLELAVVDCPDGFRPGVAHRFAERSEWPVHPLAVHNRTDAFTLVFRQARRYQLHYRYETWVQYRTRRPRPRADLAPLAARLSAAEGPGASWQFDGVAKLIPTLRLAGASDSSWSPEAFLGEVRTFLERAPGAWDPYRV